MRNNKPPSSKRIEQLERELRKQTERSRELAKTAALERQQREAAEAALRKLRCSNTAEADYAELVSKIREVVREQLPEDATLAVASKGDPDLVMFQDAIVELRDRTAWHFPQNQNGDYAGYYPADSRQAIEQVEQLRRKGAEYLVFPATSDWWLQYYKLEQYLGQRYRQLYRDEGTCTIYALKERSPWFPLTRFIETFETRHGHPPSILDWDTDTDCRSIFGDCNVFAPPLPGSDELPYLNHTIDLVLVDAHAPRVGEARRVASEAIVAVESAGPSSAVRVRKIKKGRNTTPKSRKPHTRRTAHSAAASGRILFCSHYLPQPDLDSYSRRLFHFVEFLTEANWSVTCVARNDSRYDQAAARLRAIGARVESGFEKTVERVLSEQHYDVALLGFWHVASTVLETIHRCSPETASIVDSGDIHFLRQARRILRDSAGSRIPDSLDSNFAGEVLGELNVYSAADGVIAVSQKEANWLTDLSNGALKPHFVPDSEDLAPSSIPPSQRRGIVFVGNFGHLPNLEAVEYLCSDILTQFDPAVLTEHPVYIIGSAMPESVREWAHRFPFVRLLGWTPSVVPYLEQARLSIVPLLHGAGTKRKMIQALSIGTPTVSTRVGIEGFRLRDGDEVLLADDPVTFANAMERLLRDGELWSRIASKGRDYMRAHHSHDTARSCFLRTISSIREYRNGGCPATPEARPFSHNRQREYRELVRRTRRTVGEVMPVGSRGLIVSKGDAALLEVADRSLAHFPQGTDGGYAGYYPSDSADAIRHLEELHDRGAGFLIFPKTSFWWLDHYQGFRKHLESSYQRIRHQGGSCVIYSLDDSSDGPLAQPQTLEACDSLPVCVDGALPETPRAVCDSLRRPALDSLNGFVPDKGRRGTFKVLIVGVYLADKPSNIEHIVRTLSDSVACHTVQRWAALGGEPATGFVGEATVRSYVGKTPKFHVINDLLRYEKKSKYDYVVVCDDDIVLPEAFLDRFMILQHRCRFRIAQPALTPNSFINHPIVEQQQGVLARETRFVEIGPIVSFHRSVLSMVYPFDLTSPMGSGYEHLWASRLARGRETMGIIDAVPVDHSLRQSLSNYFWADANRQREMLLAREANLTLNVQDLHTVTAVSSLTSPSCRMRRFTLPGGKGGRKKPRISVVVPTHNRARLLGKALESLAGQDMRSSDFEVIVVDDGSSASTAKVCRSWASDLRLKHVPIQRSGISAAKNLGVFVASAPVILFFDDDDLADEHLLSEHVDTHARYPLENVAVLGYTEWAPSLNVNEVMRFVVDIGHYLFSYTDLKDGQQLDFKYFWGGRASCKRSLLIRCGVFHQEFRFGSEDIELAFRISKLLLEWQGHCGKVDIDEEDDQLLHQLRTVGMTVIFNRRAVQYMNRPITFDDFCQRCEKQGRSQLQFSRLHSDGIVQQWCQTSEAVERWTKAMDSIENKIKRVHVIEQRLNGNRSTLRRRGLIKELHELYRFTFDAFKLKGIVEAMGEQAQVTLAAEQADATCTTKK